MGDGRTRYIYLIESAVRVHKIGYALDPEKRMRELEREGAKGAARCLFGLPFRAEVRPWQSEMCKPYRLLWSAPAEDYRAAERTLHKLFADRRIVVPGWQRSEWFNLRPVDIDCIRSINRFEVGSAVA